MLALPAWTPGLSHTFAVHAAVLDYSQITDIGCLIRPTGSVTFSRQTRRDDSPFIRARTVVEAIRGEIEDADVRRASGRVLAKHAVPVPAITVGQGRLTQGF